MASRHFHVDFLRSYLSFVIPRQIRLFFDNVKPQVLTPCLFISIFCHPRTSALSLFLLLLYWNWSSLSTEQVHNPFVPPYLYFRDGSPHLPTRHKTGLRPMPHRVKCTVNTSRNASIHMFDRMSIKKHSDISSYHFVPLSVFKCNHMQNRSWINEQYFGWYDTNTLQSQRASEKLSNKHCDRDTRDHKV